MAMASLDIPVDKKIIERSRRSVYVHVSRACLACLCLACLCSLARRGTGTGSCRCAYAHTCVRARARAGSRSGSLARSGSLPLTLSLCLSFSLLGEADLCRGARTPSKCQCRSSKTCSGLTTPCQSTSTTAKTAARGSLCVFMWGREGERASERERERE